MAVAVGSLSPSPGAGLALGAGVRDASLWMQGAQIELPAASVSEAPTYRPPMHAIPAATGCHASVLTDPSPLQR